MRLLLAAAAALLLVCVAAQGAPNRVHMGDITALTLYRGHHTAARRGSPIPQLKCVGGSGCYDFTPEVVQCVRTGWDGYDAQWKCSAELPSNLAFGTTTVSCEGYDGPEDAYILRGSCGLEYTLNRVAPAAGGSGGYAGRSAGNEYAYRPASPDSSSSFGSLLGVACVSPGAAGGAPYTNTYTPPTNSGYSAPRAAYPSTSSGPGFWTGAGLGGAAGYAMGRAAGPTYGRGAPSYGGGGYSASAPAPAPTTHTSTGYGGTKRR